MALLIVRSERGRKGAIRISATSDGLAASEATLQTE